MQAKEKLTLDPMTDDEGSIKGVNLNTRQAGHITFNPNVPTNDPKLSLYLPVFVSSYTLPTEYQAFDRLYIYICVSFFIS